jgi:hypothetical protein
MSVTLSKNPPAVNTVQDPTNLTVQLTDGTTAKVSESRARELVAAGASYVIGLREETL